MEAFLSVFDALPMGGSRGVFNGRIYSLAKSTFANGRSLKLVGEALDGSDYISLNLYHLPNGKTLLKPCEMPEAKVVEFVLGVKIETTQADDTRAGNS